jgi:hypothetical protein
LAFSDQFDDVSLRRGVALDIALRGRERGVTLSFWRAPERLFDEPDELVTWARAALTAARRVAAKREPTAQGENQSLNYEAGIHRSAPISKTRGADGLKALQAIIERAGQTITAT